jgi:uncharacterized protein YyaL (SSP411 family)
MPNALAGERSPYLLQHRNNPVDWMPWGEKALRRAREEQRPIFLSIGYSTCHWCHVMEHESFEDEEIAALMNGGFINIKVDREERPDLDLAYMAFVQATTGSGGWPMSVWLTPELKPFLGGTYFPPEDRAGRAGFPTVLRHVLELWENDRERIEERGAEVVAKLQEGLRPRSAETGLDVAEVGRSLFRALVDRYDAHRGGFGGAPKFPRPCVLDVALRVGRSLDEDRATRCVDMAVHTLVAMARGGMHDQVGGGFHRYSVDGHWHVPHFEKMLYDQAQLVVAYLEGYQVSGRAELAESARDILAYVTRDLRHPEGGFYSAEDADSLVDSGSKDKKEGAFYVWKQDELDALLGADAAPFGALYGVRVMGNASREGDPAGEFRGENILYKARPDREVSTEFGLTPREVCELRQRCLNKLTDARQARPRPHLDDKMLAAWNGMMISAFARAARVLGDPGYLDTALQAAGFLEQNLRASDGTLLRSCHAAGAGIAGFASDYAFVIRSYLDLFEAGAGGCWLGRAIALQGEFDRVHFDSKAGVYLSARAGYNDAIFSIAEDYDGAEPSPNSVAALNLLRLGGILHRSDLGRQAGALLRALGGVIETSPFSAPGLVVALDFASADLGQVVLADEGTMPPGPGHPLRATVDRSFLPYIQVIPLDEETRKILAGESSERAGIRDMGVGADGPMAYVCRATNCSAPVASDHDLACLLG